MRHYDTSKISHRELQNLLQNTVMPRPIAFASTIDSEGNLNLSPFSFFNAFSSNPPILIFSPSRKGRDGSLKHTFLNVKEVPEVVINMVSFEMVEQMSLASTEYPKGVNEFEKAGLTAIPSETVRPFRVKESPVQFECMVKDIIELGDEGGAGNLVICHVNMIHVDDAAVLMDGSIDADILDLVGRMGGSDYIKASGKSLFQIPKPLSVIGVGIDALPEFIRTSEYLTGNELARLGGLENLPEFDLNHQPSVDDFFEAQKLLAAGETAKALNFLLGMKD
ncbi:MAG: flavin reductase family protein [Bacteroidales bacterium]|nr:flavin reductase family protein [Bacteroidales bacterium]